MKRTAYAWLVVAVAGLVALGGVSLWVFGDRAVYVMFTGAIAWLLWDRVRLGERLDQAWDTADQALGRIEAAECHLAGLEPASTGRHADGQPQTYPWPRDSLTGWPTPPAPHA